jgi:hypothetical protein
MKGRQLFIGQISGKCEQGTVFLLYCQELDSHTLTRHRPAHYSAGIGNPARYSKA